MNEPKTFRAGDTVEWSVSHADYPANDGWTLTYYLRGASLLDITAVADGSAFDVTISAADSALLTPGFYTLQGRFSKAAEKFTPAGYITEVEVLANLATQVAGYDSRTPNRKALDLVRTAIQKYAANPVQSIQIKDRSHTVTSLADLYKLQKQLEFAVKTEENAERMSKGQRAKGRVVYGQFRKP